MKLYPDMHHSTRTAHAKESIFQSGMSKSHVQRLWKQTERRLDKIHVIYHSNVDLLFPLRN